MVDRLILMVLVAMVMVPHNISNSKYLKACLRQWCQNMMSHCCLMVLTFLQISLTILPRNLLKLWNNEWLTSCSQADLVGWGLHFSGEQKRVHMVQHHRNWDRCISPECPSFSNTSASPHWYDIWHHPTAKPCLGASLSCPYPTPWPVSTKTAASLEYQYSPMWSWHRLHLLCPSPLSD